MKLKNLFLSFLLLIPCITYSAEVFVVDGIYYQPNEDGTCYVTTAPNNGYYFLEEIVIPEEVSKDGQIFIVTEIGKSAFENCENLITISLPSTLQKIGYSSFSYCHQLENINLPDNITCIDNFAFANCWNLNLSTLPKELKEVYIMGFYNCRNIKIDKIPAKTVRIGDQAFSGCNKIPKLIFECSNLIIESKAFNSCSPLYIEMKTTDVPECSYDAFAMGIYEQTPLYVPDSSIEAFQETGPWNQFTSIIPLSKMPVYPTSMKLNVDTLIINVGETYQLEPIFTPENTTYKEVKWSSDYSPISVSNSGLVKGEFAGSATIYASCGNVWSSCLVRAVVPAESITINKTTADLYIGDTLQLTANVSPYNTTDKTVAWSSSDESIATVNEEGLVSALAEGSVVITASCGEISAKCEISITKFSIAPTITPENNINLSQIPDIDIYWSTYDFEFNDVFQGYPSLVYGNTEIDLSEYVSKSVVTSSVSTPWGSSSSTYYILKISLSKLSLTAPGEYVLNIPDKYVYIEQADIYNDEISEVFTVIGGNDSYISSSFNTTPANESILTDLNKIEIDWDESPLYECIVDVSNIAVYVNGENIELTDNEKFNVSNDILYLNLPSLEGIVGNIEIIIKEGAILSKSGKTNKEIKLTYKLVSTATGILLNIEEAELELNQTLQLEVVVLPDNEEHMPILWSTSNTNVATVSDNGLVKGVSLGVTTITATCGEISAECEITVIEDAGVESLFSDSEYMIDIYSPSGILIKKNANSEDLKSLGSGIYILKSKAKSYKINLE